MKEKLSTLTPDSRANSDIMFEEEPTNKEDLLEQISKTEQRQLQCLNKQTQMISAFYLTYVVSDIIYQMIGNLAFEPNSDFFCDAGGTVITPKTDLGAIYMLIHSLLLLSFSIMVLLVFFRIPDHYKLVAKRTNVISRLVSGPVSISLDGQQKESVEKLIKMHLNDDEEDNSISMKRVGTLTSEQGKSQIMNMNVKRRTDPF